VLSQESGRIVETDRAGNIYSTLTILSDPGNPLSIANQHHEGLTMDDQGNLYVVSEAGGGDDDHPQLWVYAPPFQCRCPADYNNDGGVDGADVSAFFQDWQDALGCSDTNGDGGVDGADVDAFFVAWEAGGCG
jgi:hypothetical protein